MKIQPRGNPSSPVWVVVDKALDQDSAKGFIFSGTIGWVFDQMWKEAGFAIEPFIIALNPDSEKPLSEDDQLTMFTYIAGMHKPTILIPLGYDSTGLLCPETISTRLKKIKKVSLEKYAGSILTSPHLPWAHYCIPTYNVDYICSNWDYRDIATSIDLGRAREEYEYYEQHKMLKALPEYRMEIAPHYDKLVELLSGYLDSYDKGNITLLSTDIETIRPTKASVLRGNPGLPYTVSFAPSSTTAISYSFWDYPDPQASRIWRLSDSVLSCIPQIGQNYFSFDGHYLKALGFRPCLERCHDTMLRHHILWPELPHKLQFLTKQYTRQKYYKDEGKSWSPKNKDKLMKYNATDTVVTFAVFEAQEEEFKERPHLR